MAVTDWLKKFWRLERQPVSQPRLALAEDAVALPKPWQISSSLSARARVKRASAADMPFLEAPLPPPGVVPRQLAKERLVAFDELVIETNAWAAEQVYNGAFFNGIGWLGYTYLAELSQRPEYRSITELLATEAVREWIEFKSASEDKDQAGRISQLEKRCDVLNVKGVFGKMVENDGFFGRSHLYIDTGASDKPDELLTSIGDGRDAITRNKFAGRTNFIEQLQPVEPVWCYPASYSSTNPLKRNWYNPQTWFCQGNELNGTRLLTFVGREVPDMLKPSYGFGGLSLSQMAKPYVDNWLRTRQAVADLVWSYSVRGIMTDLSTQLAADGNELMNRVALFADMQTNQGIMVLDKEKEEFFNIATPLGSLDALQTQAQQQMCSVTQSPVVKLLGIQPSGMNASSQGELDTWDDRVEAFQEKFLRKKLDQVIGFIMMDLWGEIDEDIVWAFRPLKSLSPLEMAQKNLAESQSDSALVEVGAIDGHDVRRRIANNPDSPYDGINPDAVIEQPQAGFENDGQLDGETAGAMFGPRPEERSRPREDEERSRPREREERVRDREPRLRVVGDEWQEADHHRASNGQFGSGEAGHLSPDERKEWFTEEGDRKFPRSREDQVVMPIPASSVNLFNETTPFRSEAPEKSQVEDVLLSSLKTWQRFVDPLKLRPFDQSKTSPITVYKYKGEYVIGNGNHRVSSAWVSGAHSIKAKVADLDDPKNKKYIKSKFRNSAADAWQEADHPRGQPGNAGQFGSGGGGGGKAKPEGELKSAKLTGGRERGADYVPAHQFDPVKFASERDRPDITPRDIYEGYTADVANRINETVQAVMARRDTKTRYKREHSYTPERAALHRKILFDGIDVQYKNDETGEVEQKHFPGILSDEAITRATPKAGEKPSFTMLGGRGGSGKSWFNDSGFLDTENAIMLDSDHIKKLLPEYEGHNAYELHEESSDLFLAVTNYARKRGLNLIHDATMKSPDKAVGFVNKFKDAGYSIEAHYMHLPREKAARRAVARFLGPTGRLVAPEVILSNTKNEEAFHQVSKLADRWSFRDNDVGRGEPPRLISESD